MTNTLHAHVSTVAVDCDGPLYRDYVETFNDDERAESGQAVNDFSEIRFMQRMLGNQASPYAAHQMRVTIDETGIQVHEDTEEGYRAASVLWCREDCDTDEHSQRDVFAEQMGY